MKPSRREFLHSSVLLAGGVSAGIGAGVEAAGTGAAAQTPTPGAPPAFGTSAPVGPAVSAETFATAEKLAQVTNTAAHRAEAAGNWQVSMAALLERRTGPRRMELQDSDVPATVWNPVLPGIGLDSSPPPRLSEVTESSLGPATDETFAFASVRQLSMLIQSQALTSERLTRLCIDRIKRFNPRLRCVITLCEEHALEQARAADREIAAGHSRGPLHGIPWGAKDLLDTAGIATTWGAEFARDRVPAEDATVTARLNAAGAVLVAKLSLGALALNDIWFGGQTMNPWCLEEGSSGSSAGPGAAVGAGLLPFAIGSETGGSIISPTMRCGIVGLRPTFGRVPRTGAMTLTWTCDKLGPMARSVGDTMLVLEAIHGPDLAPNPAAPGGMRGDLACVAAPFRQWGVPRLLNHLKIGYIDKWMHEPPATDVDRHALEQLRAMGAQVLPVTIPDWPYDSLNVILFAEAAAAFEEQTLDGRLDQLKMQVPDAWPNSFRQARFLSAVDFVQADRMRRRVAEEMARVFREVDVLLIPSLRDEGLVIFNFTGHPSLTLRAGFVEITEARSDWAPDPKNPLPSFKTPRRVPHGVTLIGRLFDEATIVETGAALETALNVMKERPAGFN